MSNGKSSFLMSNNFNGYGDKTYLNGFQRRIYTPLSQENVHRTRDFSGFILRANGGVPFILDALAANVGLMVRAAGVIPN